MKTDNIAPMTSDDDEKSVTKPKKSSRKCFSYCGAGLLIVAALVGAAVGGYVLLSNNNNTNSKSEQEITASSSQNSASESSSGELCHLTIKDSHQPILEITFAAAHSETVVNETEAREFEQAIVNAYNDASGGCSDEFKRWMYGINIVDQTVVEHAVMEKEDTSSSISHTFDNEYSLVLRLETMISCDGCINDEAFASVYPSSFGNRASTRHLSSKGQFNTDKIYDSIDRLAESNFGSKITQIMLIATNEDNLEVKHMSYYEEATPVTDSSTVSMHE